jgi:hypothetical protein
MGKCLMPTTYPLRSGKPVNKEAGMKVGAVILFGVAGLLAQPALADGTVSIGSLLAGGYEVKTITDLPNDEQKAIWPDQTPSPYLMVTFQKGNSVAVCQLATANWINLADSSLTNQGLCHKH